MTQQQFDRMTQYLISNGDVPAVTSQEIYEYAWSQGIRPLRESALKSRPNVSGRRTRPKRKPGRLHGGSWRARVWTSLMDAQQSFGSDIVSHAETIDSDGRDEREVEEL